ncbi:hypothetical protein V8D89_014830 [Ganoderma adspersum]
MNPGLPTYSLFFKLAISFSVAGLFTSVSALLVNTTLDDTSGTPSTGATILYEPASSWRSGNLSLCMNCTARPDAFRAYGETWHEGLSLPPLSGEQSQVLTASLPFNGSAVYVYCITAPFWSTDLAFYLDGERTGAFALAANTSRAYEYGVLVYASATLPLAEHTLSIESGSGSGNDTLVPLDRIIYTHDSATSASATSSSPSGASSTSVFSGPSATPYPQPHLTTSASYVYAITIPCVIGGMVLVGVVVALWGKLWRRYKRAGLPPSALYRRSVGAGTQPRPESRWVGHGGGPEDLVAGASLKVTVAEDLEAAGVGQDRPGDVGPRELPASERIRGEQGHGTPHHGTVAEEIEEVSRS